ncbi:MAG: EpsI family protein [Proteobacteria bacterium]|nr:EpsI family protein [Pseudomonadota bacterium]
MKLKYSKLGILVSLSFLIVTTIYIDYFQKVLLSKQAKEADLGIISKNIGDWKGEDVENLDNRTLNTLKLDQYIRRNYKNSKGEKVFLYVGYWKRQSGDSQAAKHSPLMCLPGNGWKISNVTKGQLDVSDSKSQTISHDYSKIVGMYQNSTALFGYWFFCGEKIYTDETAALAHIIKETVINHRSDGGIIEISVDLQQGATNEYSEKAAEETMQSFIKDFYPLIDKVIHQNALTN